MIEDRDIYHAAALIAGAALFLALFALHDVGAVTAGGAAMGWGFAAVVFHVVPLIHPQ